MFLAFAHRKIGRWSEDEQRALTLESEDALTAMILGRLRYLPIAVAWEILAASAEVLRGVRPVAPQVVKAIFWPRWTLGSREVEPDAVWETDSGVLVVEAKWNGSQDSAQIDREYAAAVLKYPQQQVTVLALGGIRADGGASLQAASLAKNLLYRSWRDIADSARRCLAGVSAGPVYEVLSDIVGILQWRGLRTNDDLQELASLPSCILSRDFSWEPVAQPRQFTDLAEFHNLGAYPFDWRPT